MYFLQSFPVFVCFLSAVHGSEEQKRLVEELFHEKNYSKLVRPVINESTPILVKFELYLASINDVVSYYFSCTYTLI